MAPLLPRTSSPQLCRDWEMARAGKVDVHVLDGEDAHATPQQSLILQGVAGSALDFWIALLPPDIRATT